ncbi:hypothetical protein [Mycobacteroides abscessus]|uniref:hypothetical protein n=1 Tax=Mycobacteroides abscessus TaxID=36809 RepID=UPI0009A700E9|nr:hypothetical protein [Mycobacteroides abscessus]SLC41735.1 Uncharacterised protein [Mycobacteroides abscessus subsp. abscessus]
MTALTEMYTGISDGDYEDIVQVAGEEVVLTALESIATLTDDERENVRHEVWLAVDAAIDCGLIYVDNGDDYATVSNTVYEDIDAAVDKGLSYTRTRAA